MSYAFAEHKGASAEAPVLFLFHGTGGDENQFFDLGRQLRPDARLVALRGDVSEGGALRYFKRLAEGRYDMADLERAKTKLAGFVGEQVAVTPGAPVFGFGYSNGANILAATQFEHPDLFERVVLLHPLIPFEPAPQPGLAGKQVLITAGRRDPIGPPALTERLAKYYREQGADTRLIWHEGGHEVREEELIAAQDFLAA